MVTPSITAIVQARMSSSRLPGKVLEVIGGYPVAIGILTRLKNSALFDQVVLATSDNSDDDILAAAVTEAGFPVVRGSLDNVLARFCLASDEFPSDYCVRITADCPFVDEGCLKDLIDFFQCKGVDYASNALEPTLPDGFDCEIFTRKALLAANDSVSTSTEREHVTYYFYQHPEIFSIASLTYADNFSEWRVTLDTQEDLELIRKLVAVIPKSYLDIRLADVLQSLKEDPSLREINSMYARNEQLGE